jgi:polysaccharide export outer membrane protein
MTNKGLKCCAGLFLPLVLYLGGCAQITGGETLRTLPSAQDLESQAVEASQEYLIGPRDALRITVWNHPELTVDDLVVRLDGKISFPLLDDVQAAGLTPTALKSVISERLDQFVTTPLVTVVVLEINSKMVYLIGEVAREGPIVFRSNMRVLDALSTAGGFNQFAGKSRVKVIRERNGAEPFEFIFDYDEFVNGENLEQNVLLLPGDRIVVPPEQPFPW